MITQNAHRLPFLVPILIGTIDKLIIIETEMTENLPKDKMLPLIPLNRFGNVEDVAAVAVHSPNYFGCIEDLATIAKGTHDLGAICIAGFTEALAYGLLRSPGACGVDIVAGEGQSLGIPMSFGGPNLGIMSTQKKYMRAMPGRLVGRATDRDGKPGYVLTLAAREQHIRREKATSSICSNQSLCALTVAMYLATLGKTGLRNLAKLNYDKAQYLKEKLLGAGKTLRFASPTFNEFVLELPEGKFDQLLEANIIAGVPLGQDYPELADSYVICATETKSVEDLDNLLKELLP